MISQCKFWVQQGRCRNGDKCRFSHAGDPPPPRACSFWETKGFCREGDKCRFSHDGPRGAVAPRACRFWAQGDCRDGDSCEYSHAVPRGVPAGAGEGGGGTDRRLFDKCTKDNNFHLSDKRTAVRFAEAVESYSEGDLPWRLTRRDEHGLQKVLEAVMVGGSDAAFPIVRALARPDWKEPRFADALRDCWHELYAGRGVIEKVTDAVRDGDRIACETRNLEALAEMAIALVLAEKPQGGSANALQALADVVFRASHERGAQTAHRRADRCRQLLRGAPEATPKTVTVDRERRPGGRHANDHCDFRRISIVPTIAEVQCEATPFLPRSKDEAFLSEDPETQLLDRHFRLLREDMLAPLREHIGNGTGEKIEVTLAGFDFQERGQEFIENRDGELERRTITSPGPIGILFVLKTNAKPQDLVDALQQRGQLRPGNLFLLQKRSESETVTNLEFGRVIRMGVSQEPPVQVELSASFADPVSIMAFETAQLQLLLVGGSFFAYEPVLQCLQDKEELQFREEMLLETNRSPRPEYPGVELLQGQLDRQLDRDGVNIDAVQRAAFRHAIDHRIANIVGPPGTGKSFVAVEIALAVLHVTDLTMLVVCYTNHALDDFLGRLLDRGFQNLVRMGGRSNAPHLEPFNLRIRAQSAGHQGGSAARRRIWELKKEQAELRHKMRCAEQTLKISSLRWSEAQEAIEAAEDGATSRELLRQLSLPGYGCFDSDDDDAGFALVGKRGKEMRADHLWKAWQNGFGPEPFHERADCKPWVWSKEMRQRKLAQWLTAFKQDSIEQFDVARRRYDALNNQLSELHRESERAVLKDSRVIGATTTGAAKYKSLIESAKVGFVLIEEAGEVLEAHVHTSLGEHVRHLVMIGDHRQLRPKVEAHALTVAAKNGYDLNRSLFERLILGGLPHAELEVQHRMRPEIAAIARHMTYPTLRDGDMVAHRPDVRGLAANVIFIKHSELEQGSGDEVFGTTLSKSNQHEADVSVQVVRFLLTHGYRSSDLVVLTPYLGQLRLIKSCMKKANLDAVLGDKDTEDLLLHGEVVQPLQGDGNKLGAVRVSTVDNYQGEEADVVISSLVRSNKEGQLGFLGKADAEQRVNVLCTRARCGLILIGNAECLERSSLWKKLLGFLGERGCIYDGLPVKCQRHGSILTPAAFSRPSQLEELIRRGSGCESRCDTILDCGHPCPFHCHPFGHDQVRCPHLVPTHCRAGLHRINRVCSEQSPPECHKHVIDQCERAHPVVRRCKAAVARCRVCNVLNAGETEQEQITAHFAEQKTAVFAQFAEAVVASGSNKQVTSESTARATLKKLADDLEEQQRELDRGLGQKIADAEAETRAEMERVRRAQVNQRESDERELAARQADMREQLRTVEEQMEQRRIEVRAEAEAEVRRRDEDLQRLHDTLQKDLEMTEEALQQAVASRPDRSNVEKQLDEVREMAPDKRCSICMDDLKILDGILCQAVGDGHFVCKVCFEQHVKNEAERQEFGGEIRCPFASRALGGCSSQPYKDYLIARYAPEAFEIYNDQKLKLREIKITQEMEHSFEERLAEAKAKMAAASQQAKVAEAREYIIENILTLRCPRCRQAFLDFEGCFALTCSRQSCGCAFCAHCLKDCGTDAHACAGQCGRQRGMSVFGSRDQFEAIQKERKSRLVQEYLSRAELRGELKAKVLDACRHELADLNLMHI